MSENPVNQHSSDDEGYRTKIITLTRENWVQWSCQLENFLTGKGHEVLLSPPSESDKVSSKFKRQNSSALALLWTCVSPDLQGILLANKGSFYDSWDALGKTCGKNSIVVMCDTLFKLMSLQYSPGSSLEKHIDDFQKTYASYESITLGSDNAMTISTTIAAAFFIRSLKQDRELSGLVQMLYDIKPFKLKSVLNHVAIEHCHRGSDHKKALVLDKQGQSDQNKPPQSGNNQGCGKKKLKGQGKGKAKSQSKRNDDSLKRLEKLEKLFAKLETKSKDLNINVIAEASKDPLEDPQESDSDAYVMDNEVLTLGCGAPDEIYLDSGAGRSVVNQLGYLSNVVQVEKQVNTYAEPPVFKGGAFLIMCNKKIVAKFNRSGNLFSSRLHSHSILTVNPQVAKKDWHTVLGHPSDAYIQQLLNNKKLSGSFTSSSKCPVCLHAKIKRQPHIQHLPYAHSPFEKIHMDTLEISPPTRQGFRYLLVIVDYFSRFNRIAPMTEKKQAQGLIMSFLNELRNKLSITPGYIHMDWGGEFDSNLFQQQLLTQGISLERGPPHSPQTNGVAERFNQTILTKIRCLLGQSNIPISYWDEAARHASLLLNLLPH
ncbi:hypothetical protein O181_015695 [Austropuccinia psidii MF-1]|uniref:Integrase catalytic domain-containing protein n=1 Tax=Austropuccinia psidii MF-1 TaxID=1389203 RepID=A0A9Q3C4E3_9BASI|nr:hypothetical protein [Austropuccinia psidii MF-1]